MPEIGQTISRYRILEKIGVGGMGEVYLADDISLDRKVALKFLPDLFTDDPERMARFEREAKLLASLNHPKIAAIYGLEQAEGKRFLIMEYVEGETLQARLSKGALPLEEALNLCGQVAEGLEAAHEKGVIHRDLKPANVMIAAEEKVKILDFGLAKALSDDTQSIDSSQSPTLTEAMTRPGVILGTAAYMSPEQAKGKSVDKRADIWAFGCILYECLAGRKAFEGETVTEILAAVLRGEPDWQALPANVPQNIRFVLRRCLEKERNRRFRDAADVQIEIEEAPNIVETSPPAKQRRLWVAWTIASIFALAFALISFIHFRKKPVTLMESTSLQINIPDDLQLTETSAFAVSPNGRDLAFAAAGIDGKRRIWLRNLSSPEARPLSGTESSFLPPFFWSPDSRFIAFGSGGTLKKIDVSSQVVQTICPLSGDAVNGAWNKDDVILFTDYSASNEILKVSATGGSVSSVTRLNPERQEIGHFSPAFLPDGRHFVYLCSSSLQENTGVRIGSLDSKPEEQDATVLLNTSMTVSYVPSLDSEPEQLIFLQGQTLMAQPLKDRKLFGAAVPIAENVGSDWIFSYSSVSTNGVLVYRPRATDQITWSDRTGKELGTIGDPGFYPTFDLSTDAKKLIVQKRTPDGDQNLWVIDLLRNSTTRLTLDAAEHFDPRWTYDDRQVVFGSVQDGVNVLSKVSPGTSPTKIVALDNASCYLDDLSPDGRYLLYHNEIDSELWALPLIGDQKPIRVSKSLRGVIDQSQFSPNGQWIAYNTDESSRHEVVVVPFPPTEAGDKWQISTEGGAQPTWRGDSRELYFLALDGSLMAVEIEASKTFTFGDPKRLFKLEFLPTMGTEQYAPHPGGQKFLIVKPSSDSAKQPFTVVLNWTSKLKK